MRRKHSVLTLTLLTCATLGHVRCLEDSCDAEEQSCPTRSCINKIAPTESSILFRDSNGRLGNLMFLYKMMTALKLKFGYRIFVSRRTFDIMNPFFEDLQLLVGEEELCGFDQMYEEYKGRIREQRMGYIKRVIEAELGYEIQLERDSRGRWDIPRELVDNTDIKFDQIVHNNNFDQVEDVALKETFSDLPWQVYTDREIFDLAADTFSKGKAILAYPKGYSPFRNETDFLQNGIGLTEALEKAFTLRKHFRDLALESLTKATEQYHALKAAKISKDGEKKKHKKKKKKAIVYVGIHSRRTDHLAYEKEKGSVPLKPSYYIGAMDMYREKYKGRVIFLYISDDLDWGMSTLGPRNKHGDIFFVGEGNAASAQSIGHDLALMAMCNHTIISHGTFSHWAGFLAGGTVITPQHFPEYRTAKTDAIFKKHPLNDPLPRLHEFV